MQTQHSPGLRVSCLKGKHRFTSVSFIKRPLKHLISCRFLPLNAHGRRHFAEGQAGYFLCPAPRALTRSAHAPRRRLRVLKSYSGLKLLEKMFPLLHMLNQMNEHDSQSLFSSFPAHHRDSWAGRGQCHSTEVNGMMPIYISWWFKPLDFLSGTHFFSTKPGYKAESRTYRGENTHSWFKLTLPPLQLHHNSRNFAEITSV